MMLMYIAPMRDAAAMSQGGEVSGGRSSRSRIWSSAILFRAIADGEDYKLPGTVEDASVVDAHVVPALMQTVLEDK